MRRRRSLSRIDAENSFLTLRQRLQPAATRSNLQQSCGYAQRKCLAAANAHFQRHSDKKLILSNLKSGHLVAGIFLWFEQMLIKWRTGSASVLKEIDDRSLLILAIIATRSPRDGNKWSKKSAIIRLIGIQFAKSSIFIVFLSYYMVSIYQFYENDKFISAHNTVFTILILAFGTCATFNRTVGRNLGSKKSGGWPVRIEHGCIYGTPLGRTFWGQKPVRTR